MQNHTSDQKSIKKLLRHYLADITYGGNDGIITTFAVISGVFGADLTLRAMIIIAIVSLFADGFSMAASNYLAIRSQAEANGHSRGVREPISHAYVTFFAFIFFGSMPLLAFLIYPYVSADPFLVSSIFTGITLLLLGIVRSSVSHRKWYQTGAENLLIGAVAATVAYYCGKILSGIFNYY